MKTLNVLRRFNCVLLLFLTVTGCSKHDHSEHEHDEKEQTANATSGFKEGQGVYLAPETEKSLAIKTSGPVEKVFRRRSEAIARIYAVGKATALIDSNTAAALVPGSSVIIEPAGKSISTGTLVRIERQFEQSIGQAEALIEFADHKGLSIGASVPVMFASRETSVELTVPEKSLLETGDGHFVFVFKDGHFARKPVSLGARAEGWVEITGGLLANEIMVTNGVQGLRCIELQATKAGTPCCPVDHK